MNNELVIDVSATEIVIALLEDKQLVELSKEKSNTKFTVGDIYLGRVKKIMGGLNAAFVDVGYQRDAFLHYLDLGPQFMSQDEFLRQSLAKPDKILPIQDFRLKKDINKNGRISEVLVGGQSILVQIAKEPISTKGPRISSEISIAGRNLVLIPFSEKVSVSQKIKSKEERDRLKRLIQSIKPKNYGVIVRTVATNRRVAVLDTELRELIERWESAFKDLQDAKPPKLMVGELSRTSAILRDILNSDFNSIHVNDESIYKEIKNYINQIAPEKQKIVKKYSGRLPIFDNFGVTKQIKGLFGKTVTIKNGAYLIIEHTEALHVIDVNSGNRTKKSNDQETNALEVNLVSAEEIARQLRLRDMGGIIVVDFIDMHSAEHRHMVFDKMKQAMSIDRTKHNILPLSKFGLMQITRQRVRPEMNIETVETCPVCRGTGEISPTILLTDEIENRLVFVQNKYSENQITLKVHSFVAAFLTKGLFSKRRKWARKHKMKIQIIAEQDYNFLEFHFFNSKEKELKS